MNVIDLLVRDHATVAALFQAFFEADPDDDETRRNIVMAEAQAPPSIVSPDDPVASEGARRTSEAAGLDRSRPGRLSRGRRR